MLVCVLVSVHFMNYELYLVCFNAFVFLFQNMGEELALAVTRYRKEMFERKKLHNLVQELKGNIRVFMR